MLTREPSYFARIKGKLHSDEGKVACSFCKRVKYRLKMNYRIENLVDMAEKLDSSRIGLRPGWGMSDEARLGDE